MDFIKSGQFISELRKAKSMTQADLGAILGVTDKTVSKWERGVNIPDILMIREIAKVFDVTADEILAGEKDSTETSAILKVYRNKKFRYAMFGIITVVFISLMVLSAYFTNNFDKSKIYRFYQVNKDYELSGYIYGVGNQMRIVLDDLDFERAQEYENLKIRRYIVKIFLNDNIAYNHNMDYENEHSINFLQMMNDIEKMSVTAQNVNIDLIINDGYFLLEFLDDEHNSYELKFDFKCTMDLRNNRFFYK